MSRAERRRVERELGYRGRNSRRNGRARAHGPTREDIAAGELAANQALVKEMRAGKLRGMGVYVP